MLQRRRLLFGGVIMAGAAAAEPVRRLLLRDSSAPAPFEEPPPVAAQQGGELTLRLPGLSADGSPFTAALSAASVFQGGTVRLRTSTGTNGTASLLGRSYTLLPAPGGGLEGYLSLGTGDPAGAATVSVAVVSGPFNETAALPLTVVTTDWNVDYLEIPPAPPGEPDPFDPVEAQREIDLLAATYGTFTPERHWTEPWLIPMQGDITSHFGDQRSINGGPVAGHHSGTDIATPFGETPGAPIHAANHGVVVVSERVNVRGNLVIINHGGGVYTGYGHMSERIAQVGDFVSQGDVIGVEGATGLVTGAHLHWEVSVGGVLVDGLRWLDGSQGF